MLPSCVHMQEGKVVRCRTKCLWVGIGLLKMDEPDQLQHWSEGALEQSGVRFGAMAEVRVHGSLGLVRAGFRRSAAGGAGRR
jgi:hypothetical protein